MSSALARIQARSSRPAPSFAHCPGAWSGVHRLAETPMLINGLAPDPSDRRAGLDALVATWPAYGFGETLSITGAGAAPVTGLSSPLLGPRDGAVEGKGGKSYVGASATIGNPGTDDVTWEIYYRAPLSSTVALASKRQAPASDLKGWTLYATSTQLRLGVDVGGTDTDVLLAAHVAGTWNHALIPWDRSENSTNGLITYLNAVAQAGLNLSAYAATINPTDPLRIGSQYGTLIWDAGLMIGFFAMRQAATWHPGGAANPTAWQEVAKQRWALLHGARPFVSWAGDLYPVVQGTTVPAHQDRIISGARQLFYTAANTPRFAQRNDADGRSFTGAYVEPGATNICLQSQTFATAPWAPFNASMPATAVVCPDGVTRTTVTLHEDATAGVQHYLVQGSLPVTIGTPYVITLWVKAVARNWIVFGTAQCLGYFNALTGVAGSLSGTGTNKVSSVEGWGNGWYRCRVSWTANATGVQALYVQIAEADGDPVFDGLDQDSLRLFGAQFETGTCPTSYIITTASAATRAAGVLRYAAANLFGSSIQGALRFRFLTPASFTPSSNCYLAGCSVAGGAADRIHVYLDTSGRVNVESAKTGGAAGAVQLAGNKCDGYIHEVLVSWRTNDLRLCVDGTWAAPDTTVDIAAFDRLEVGMNHASASQAGPVLVGDLKAFPRFLSSWADRGSGFTVLS